MSWKDSSEASGLAHPSVLLSQAWEACDHVPQSLPRARAVRSALPLIQPSLGAHSVFEHLLVWGLPTSQMGSQPQEDMFQTGSHRGKEIVTAQDGKCQCHGGRSHPRPWDSQGLLTPLPGRRGC